MDNLSKKICFSFIVIFCTLLPSIASAQFSEITTSLPQIYGRQAIWGDYDNDGDLDLLISGYLSPVGISKLFRNDGGGIFTDINADLIGTRLSTVAWGDYDNDGDLDILMTGYIGTNCISSIYKNDGNGTFSDIGAGLIGCCSGTSYWIDYDKDGDLDVFLSGELYNESTWPPFTTIYRNDNGIFTNITPGFIQAKYSSASWGDYDNDGFPDLILMGYNSIYNPTQITKIYHNNGNGLFSDSNIDLQKVESGDVEWGDFNNDGYLDIAITGATQTQRVTTIYKNNGNQTFESINAELIGSAWGSIQWGDYDNDKDLDLVLTGDMNINPGGVKIYKNEIQVQNTAPTPPTNLRTSIEEGYVLFQWDNATDEQTSQNGLNYNVRIGSTPGDCDILSPMSLSNGKRLLPSFGNSGNRLFYKIKIDTLPQDLYWTVQSIDGAYCASTFAQEQEFSFLPVISLQTQPIIKLGNVIVLEESELSSIITKNNGAADLQISQLHFRDIESQFSYTYPNISLSILPGAIDTIFVKFSPTSVGASVDTLYIESNASNMPVLKIKLTGTGLYVPPSTPQNITFSMQGWNNYDALVNWDAVTTNTHGSAITPDYYFIYYNGSDIETNPFYFLGYTNTTSFTHMGVGFGAEHMFYRVKAIKFYTRGEEAILEKLRAGMTEEEVEQIVKN